MKYNEGNEVGQVPLKAYSSYAILSWARSFPVQNNLARLGCWPSSVVEETNAQRPCDLPRLHKQQEGS